MSTRLMAIDALERLRKEDEAALVPVGGVHSAASMAESEKAVSDSLHDINSIQEIAKRALAGMRNGGL